MTQIKLTPQPLVRRECLTQHSWHPKPSANCSRPAPRSLLACSCFPQISAFFRPSLPPDPLSPRPRPPMTPPAESKFLPDRERRRPDGRQTVPHQTARRPPDAHLTRTTLPAVIQESPPVPAQQRADTITAARNRTRPRLTRTREAHDSPLPGTTVPLRLYRLGRHESSVWRGSGSKHRVAGAGGVRPILGHRASEQSRGRHATSGKSPGTQRGTRPQRHAMAVAEKSRKPHRKCTAGKLPLPAAPRLFQATESSKEPFFSGHYSNS